MNFFKTSWRNIGDWPVDCAVDARFGRQQDVLCNIYCNEMVGVYEEDFLYAWSVARLMFMQA